MPLLFRISKIKYNWLMLSHIMCFSFVNSMKIARSVTYLIGMFLHFINIASFFYYFWSCEDDEYSNLLMHHVLVQMNLVFILICWSYEDDEWDESVPCAPFWNVVIFNKHVCFCYWFENLPCVCAIYYCDLHFQSLVWNHTLQLHNLLLLSSFFIISWKLHTLVVCFKLLCLMFQVRSVSMLLMPI